MLLGVEREEKQQAPMQEPKKIQNDVDKIKRKSLSRHIST